MIGPMLGLMTMWVVWWNGRLPGLPDVTPAMSAVFLLGPYTGPFVGLWGPVIGYEADSPAYMCGAGLPLLAMIASHPAYPRPWTGALCAIGVLVWFFMSMSFIHQAGG